MTACAPTYWSFNDTYCHFTYSNELFMLTFMKIKLGENHIILLILLNTIENTGKLPDIISPLLSVGAHKLYDRVIPIDIMATNQETSSNFSFI